MTRRKKTAILAAGAAAFAVAGGGAALAASDAFSPEEERKAIIDDAAEQLGVEPSELSAALKQALKNRVDAAVEAGRLTEEQGAALKERIDSGETPLLYGGFGGHRHWGHGPFGGPFAHFPSFESAASYLGLTEEELRSELADGKSLGEIAKEQGKTVDGLVQALVDAATERIDQAVEDGKLTAAQAADLKKGLEERITELVSREPGLHRGFPRRHGYHFGQPGFGFGQFHGPTPPSAGPRA
jgi:hypothetical protein